MAALIPICPDHGPVSSLSVYGSRASGPHFHETGRSLRRCSGPVRWAERSEIETMIATARFEVRYTDAKRLQDLLRGP